MSQKVVSVSTLVHYLKGKLDNDALIQRIMVQGEISNFTNHRSGHWYFTLKDAQSRISCVMFQSYARQCSFLPKDGDQVILTANTSLFEASGQLQLYGVKMQLDGLGEYYLKYEQLKRKLAAEGLFDARLKKQIPAYPTKIGLVTGKNTAAREDVVSTIKRRWPIAKIVEFATLVQGDDAPEEIMQALKEADLCKLDVILLVRGGGSIEDLWAFNNETLAREIFKMQTPLISGVGHEVDVTIVDYVADLRAPTPTGAAEMAVPDMAEVLNYLNKDKQRLYQATLSKLNKAELYFHALKDKRVFAQPEQLFEKNWLKLNYYEMKLRNTNYLFNEKSQQFIKIKNQFSTIIQNRCHGLNLDLIEKKTSLNQLMNMRLTSSRSRLLELTALFDAYSPLKSLLRGYSLVYKDNQLLSSIIQIEKNDQVKVQLSDGIFYAAVLEKEKKDE